LASKAGLEIKHHIKWISLGAENVTETHKRNIKRFFKVSPIQHYGLAEGVANLSMVPGHDHFFIDEDFSYVELLPHQDQYSIIGTNFSNYAFPLIRYHTSDLASGVNQTSFPRIV